jgi:hypothetical protein
MSLPLPYSDKSGGQQLGDVSADTYREAVDLCRRYAEAYGRLRGVLLMLIDEVKDSSPATAEELREALARAEAVKDGH